MGRIRDHLTFGPPSSEFIPFPDLDFHHLLVLSFPLQHINGKAIDSGFLIEKQSHGLGVGVQSCVEIETENIWIWISREAVGLFTFPISWQRCQLVFSEFLFSRQAGM